MMESPWTVYRTRFVVRARQLTEPLSFTDALGREHCGQPGDYLVESLQGFRRITPRALFEDIYVPLENAPPPSPHVSSGRPVRPVDLEASPRSDSAERRLLAWSGTQPAGLGTGARLVARSS